MMTHLVCCKYYKFLTIFIEIAKNKNNNNRNNNKIVKLFLFQF